MRTLSTLLLLLGLTCAAHAADDPLDYPKKPVRMLVPLAAGGALDVLARLIGQKLGDAWGQQIVVETRPGAAGTVGSAIVAKAPPDGYMLLMTTNAPITTHLALYKKLEYGADDFAPIRLIAYAPVVLIVNAASGPKTIAELVELSRKLPGGLSVATTGNGSIGHFLLTHMQRSMGAQLTHVPYKGGVPGATAVTTGEAHLGILDTGATVPFIRDNRVRALGIVGQRRAPALPDVPTLSEQGVSGGDIIAWAAIAAPKGTPKSILDKVSEGVGAALRDTTIRERIITAGMAPVDASSPEHFTGFLREEQARWRRLVEEAGLKAE